MAPWTPLWQPPLHTTLFQPASTAGQANQNLLTGLDFFSGNDPTKAVFPNFSHPRNRRPEPMQYEIVDRALAIVERSAEVRDHAGGCDNPRRVAADAPGHARGS